MNDKNKSAKQPNESARKRYARPVLQRYGSIRAITQDIGSKGNPDGGTSPKIKSR
jgi:hypothetical protein